LTWSPEIFIRETQRELDLAGSQSLWGHPLEQWKASSLVGTPEQVSEKIATYLEMGCVGFVPWCADYPDTTTLDLFAQVAANFR
jgi:alkanesulfonate monooxygenase SsuD/methylene tetrahydromethanopterin reductase-like flavin-dependent oxidoreductase (luciferase family)